MSEREMVSADEAQVFAQVAERTGHGDSLTARLARTVIALHAIVEGRTVPPTDDERAVDVLRAAAVAAGHPAADGDPDAQLCAVRAQAWREGAEAMREACVEELDSVRRGHASKARDQKATIEDRAHAWERAGAIEDAAGEIEALPVPPCPEVSR